MRFVPPEQKFVKGDNVGAVAESNTKAQNEKGLIAIASVLSDAPTQCLHRGLGLLVRERLAKRFMQLLDVFRIDHLLIEM